MEQDKIAGIEETLGYEFQTKALLIRALTRKDAVETEEVDHDYGHQEIYATLGDAVLKAVLVHKLIDLGYDTKGDITSTKESIENREKLSKIGEKLGIDGFMLTSKNEDDQQIKTDPKPLAETLEALIGAIYLDGGYDAAKEFVSRCKEFKHLLSLKKEKNNESK